MSDPVTYTAVLPVAEETVLFVSRLLAAERRRRGTRAGRRALGCYRQAVLVLRWFVDGTRLAQLATDHRIGRSTAYRYLHEDHAALADLGYEGEQATLTIPIKRTADRPLTADQRTVNALHAATRALAERGNSLLKTTFKALRRVSLCPWRIGAITAAALVLLHQQHGRTT